MFLGVELIGEEPVIATPKRNRLNDEITTPRIRLIDAEGQQVGVVTIAEAIAAAVDAGLDLVEISPTAEPPVCRIMDHGKFVFEKKKRQSAAKKKQKQVHVKEIKFRPGTDEGDYKVKLRNLRRFLDNGDKCKVTCAFAAASMHTAN